MPTTADYLNKLVEQKNTLADNLVTKGVTATHDEALDTLVPKVLDISGEPVKNGIYPIGEDGRPTGDVVVPEGVTTLSQYIFYQDKNVTSVSLPKSLTTLGERCFSECAGLIDLPISDNVTTLKQSGCYKCTSLKSVRLPKNLETIEGFMFQYCSALDTIDVPDDMGYITIGTRVFEGTLIDSETFSKIASKASTLYTYAFAGINSIVDVTVNILSANAFNSCTNLEQVVILNAGSSRDVPQEAFYGCKKLRKVIIPDTITLISNNAFRNCLSLADINIPESLTYIGPSAFYGCSDLCNLNIPEGASFRLGSYSFAGSGVSDDDITNLLAHASQVDDNVFNSCNAITSVNTHVASPHLFKGCTSLISAVLNEVTFVGAGVFNGCTALKTVYLPPTITSEESNCLTTTSSSQYIFYGCTALEDVQLGPDWNRSIRLDVSTNITVDSMVTMFNALKDLTGETAKTLTFGSTNLAKLTDEQKAIATNKNWNLA